jgi:integrase
MLFFRFLAANGWSFWDASVRGGGAHLHRTRRVERLPNVFVIKLRPGDRRRPHVMLEEEVARVWDYLGSGAVPQAPADVVRNPARPRAEWSPGRKAAWAAARTRYARRLAWHRRNRFLWALALASGMRRQELPLLMVGDVHLYRGELWVDLKVRREHSHLGQAKTGPRQMFVGFDARVPEAWSLWLQSRSVLVSAWVHRTGQPDHGMLLVDRKGGPLTPTGLPHLLKALTARLGLFGDEQLGEGGFRLHPHALRHTIKALFDEWGVDPAITQRHLGHRRADTTERYGKTFRTTYVETLRTVAARALQSGEDA